jgi:CHAT domain-containing protein
VQGKRLERVLGDLRDRVEATILWQQEATREAIAEALSGGEYDIFHFAGHAFFDQAYPGRSGIICANQETFTGFDAEALTGEMIDTRVRFLQAFSTGEDEVIN